MVTFAVVTRPDRIVAFARAHWSVGLLAGVLSVAGYLAFLAAAQVLPLAPLSALRECSLIFGTIIGTVVLKEALWPSPHRRRRVVACGVIALAAGASR